MPALCCPSIRSGRRRFAASLAFLAGLVLWAAGSATAPAQQGGEHSRPDLEALRRLEVRVARAVRRVAPATVSVRLHPDGQGGQGSGVIVSPDGLVLTAAHCFPEPGKKAWVMLPDGRRLEALTLGKNAGTDAGMMRITTPGRWPFVEVADSKDLRPRQFCLALGHPGGFEASRAPVVRFGTLLGFRAAHGEFLRSTCVVRPGDSGGPLVDLDGRVIGIHSNISSKIRENYHVPSGVYLAAWKELLAGAATKGGAPDTARGGPPVPYVGLRCRNEEAGCFIVEVQSGSPADRAGLKAGDRIVSVDGVSVVTRQEVKRRVRESRVGDRLRLRLLRGEESLGLRVKLTEAPK